MPIQDPGEMEMTLEETIDRLEQSTCYPALFLQAFGSSEINGERISRALAAVYSFNPVLSFEV